MVGYNIEFLLFILCLSVIPWNTQRNDSKTLKKQKFALVCNTNRKIQLKVLSFLRKKKQKKRLSSQKRGWDFERVKSFSTKLPCMQFKFRKQKITRKKTHKFERFLESRILPISVKFKIHRWIHPKKKKTDHQE